MPQGVGYGDPFLDAMLLGEPAPAEQIPDPFAVQPEPDHFLAGMGAAPAPFPDGVSGADLAPTGIPATPEPEPTPLSLGALPRQQFRLIMDPNSGEPGQFQLADPAGELVDEPTPAQPPAMTPPPAAELERPALGPDVSDFPEVTPEDEAQAAEQAQAEGTFFTPFERRMAMSPEQRAQADAVRQTEREADISGQVTSALEKSESQIRTAEARMAEVNRRAAEETESIYRDAKELAGKQIDPDRYMSSRSAGQQLAMAMSAIIGGLLSPYRGGKNSGVEFILGQIDQDIATQRANLDSARAGIGQRRGLVGDLVAQGKSSFAATETARVALLDNAIEQIKASQASLDPEGTAAIRAQQAVDQLTAAKQEHQAKLAKANWDRQMEVAKFQASRSEADDKLWQYDPKRKVWTHPIHGTRGGGGGGSKGGPSTVGAGVFDIANALGLDKAQRERLIVLPGSDPKDPSSYGLANSTDQRKDLQDRINATNSFVTIGSRLARSIKQHGWQPTSERWTSGPGAQMQSDRTSLLFMIKDMEKGGALDKGLVDIVGGLIGGDPGKVRLSNAEAERLERTIQTAIDRAQQDLRGDTGNTSLRYSPPWSTAIKSPGLHLVDTSRGVERIGEGGLTKERATEVSQDFLTSLERSDVSHVSRPDIQRAIDAYDKVPREERMVLRGGKLVDPREAALEALRKGQMPKPKTGSEMVDEFVETERARLAAEEEARRAEVRDILRGGR